LNLIDYFNRPSTKRQKQYEAVRAFVIDNLSAEDIATKFNYSINTVYTLIRDAKKGKLQLFPVLKLGPTHRQASNIEIEKVIQLRQKNFSVTDIYQELSKEGIAISESTVERILKDNGYEKLSRRSDKERGITKKNKIIPQRSENINFAKLEKFSVDCPVAGIYFFIPYIIESGILDVVKKCQLPESKVIGNIQAALSMLALKLIGNQRLSNVNSYDHEPGLGIFAGLNVLPKPNYMGTYSCLTSPEMLIDFQREIMSKLVENYPRYYKGNFINLDFHSIPHFGELSEMEQVWCGAKNKTMKGANTLFVQDSESNMILFTKADILRKEESLQIKEFVNYWKQVKDKVNETLVFDCKLTKYEILDELTNDAVKFITLRKRCKNLIEGTVKIPENQWKKIKLNIPKRKHVRISVFEQQVKLRGCDNIFRQIIVKDHGRINPTFIITNNAELTIYQIIEVYAKRWHIENKLSELVTFFNLNALSSPIMIRIHFDIIWTMIADTLYHIFAADLRRFEKTLSPTIFKQFVNMPGSIIYDNQNFIVKIRKRATTPILKSIQKLNKPIQVPWLDNKFFSIEWTS
jgi:transposase